jgi:Zn-dependent oligopeptidase
MASNTEESKFIWKYLCQSDTVIYETNLLIKKSRSIRSKIIKLNPKTNSSLIISLLADDNYEFNNFHSISALFQVTAPNKQLVDVWTSAGQIMDTYVEEFNTDASVYKKIIEVLQENKLDNEEKLFLNKLVSSFKKYGTHLNNDSTADIYNKINQLRDKIKVIESKITNQILSEKNISTKDIGTITDPALTQMIKTNASINLTRNVYYTLVSQIQNNIKRRDIENKYYSKSDDTLPDLVKLILLRNEYANLLNNDTYMKYRNPDHNSTNVREFMRDLVVKLNPKCINEVNNIQKIINVSNDTKIGNCDILYCINKFRNQSNFNLTSSAQTILLLIKQLFGIEFQKLNIKAWGDNVTTYLLSDEAGPLGYLYLDLKEHNNRQRDAICINLAHSSCYPYNKNIFKIGSVALIGGYPDVIAYSDIALILREFGNVIRYICHKAKLGFLNNDDEFNDLIPQIMEFFAWDVNTVKQFCGNNQQLLNRLIQSYELDIGIRIKAKIINALFDDLIHSSHTFINYCKEAISLDKPTIINTMLKVYREIYSQIMSGTDKISCDNISINPNLIMQIVNGSETYIADNIMAEICSFKIFNIIKNNNLGKVFKTEILYESVIQFKQNLKKFIVANKNKKDTTYDQLLKDLIGFDADTNCISNDEDSEPDDIESDDEVVNTLTENTNYFKEESDDHSIKIIKKFKKDQINNKQKSFL